MTLSYILITTLVGSLLSLVLAYVLTPRTIGPLVRHLVSLSTGMLLGTALLHVLPEAFDSGKDSHSLFMTLLGGLMFFFLLEKADLYRHNHHHEHDDHHHHHGFDADQAGQGGWGLLIGDSIHNFCDGVLIAAAFLVSPKLGVITALAVIAHEIPQEIGDFIVLINAGLTRQRALLFNIISGMTAVLGGLAGYYLLRPLQDIFPYLMVFGSSSLIYVAVADLIPQLQQRHLSLKETITQIALITLGLGTISLLVRLTESH